MTPLGHAGIRRLRARVALPDAFGWLCPVCADGDTGTTYGRHMSLSHLHGTPGPGAERRSIGPKDGVGLAGFLLALSASVAVWAVAIVLLILVLG